MNLTSGLESISFQGDKFFNELSGLIAPWVGQPKDEIALGPLSDQLHDAILKRFKMDVAIVMGDTKLGDGYAFSYFIPPGDHGYQGKRQNAGIQLDALRKLKVDFNKVTIEGDLSAFNLRLFVETDTLANDELTAQEHAAIILHELGHAFYTFSLVGLTASTNYALRDVVRGYDKATYQSRIILIANAARELDLDGLNAEELAQAADAGLVVLAVHGEQVNRHRSELGIEHYDLSESEALADIFASRFGAGKALLTGLNKLTRGHEKRGQRYRALARSRVAGRVIRVTLMSGLFVALGTAMPVSLAALFAGSLAKVGMGAAVKAVLWLPRLLLIFGAVAIVREHREEGDMAMRFSSTYDNFPNRLRRIRQQMQLEMRTMKLTPAQEIAYLDDINELDAIIAEATNYDFTQTVFTLVHPKLRQLKNQTALNTLYENLAYNRLHDSALALKHA